jgi:hypothetical protein
MCADACDSDLACQGIFSGFACADAGTFGQCMPTSPSTQCVPANQYTLGSKVLGQCCTATHDATAGLECLGGRCDGFGDATNPFICDQACNSAVDCPGPYDCLQVGDTYMECVPQAAEQSGGTYTCN